VDSNPHAKALRAAAKPPIVASRRPTFVPHLVVEIAPAAPRVAAGLGLPRPSGLNTVAAIAPRAFVYWPVTTTMPRMCGWKSQW
jgi:hypothetical protein